MAAWIGARSLSRVDFADRFFDPSTSSAAIDKLRAAAEGVRTATTQQDLADASADIAGAMRSIGLEKWLRFLDDAATRAEAYQPAAGRISLAQTTALNTATDASPGGKSADATPRRYVDPSPRRWIGQPPVGDGECVALVRAATNVPLARE
jgi:hypothetical protein